MLSCKTIGPFAAILVVLGLLVSGCSNGISPVGYWKGSGYPPTPALPVYLEIRNDGTYSYSSVPGSGTWSLSGGELTLNAYSTAREDTLGLEDHPKMLRTHFTDGESYFQIGKPSALTHLPSKPAPSKKNLKVNGRSEGAEEPQPRS